METQVTLGSSAANVRFRWFIAALDAPYDPQQLYAFVDAPDDVKMTRPLFFLNEGRAALIYNNSVFRLSVYDGFGIIP